MKKRVAGILLGISMITVLFSGCGDKKATEVANEDVVREETGNGDAENASEEEQAAEEPEKDPAIPVGVLLPENSTKNGLKDGVSFTEAFAEKNYQALVFYADSDAETQLKQFQEVMEQDVAAIVIDPVDPYAFTETFAEANKDVESKLKLIAYDDLIMDTDQLSYYVTFDTRAIGWQAAERVIKDFSLDKMEDGAAPLTIEFYMGSLDDMGALFYFNGIMEKLQPYIDGGKLVCKSGKLSFSQNGNLRNDVERVRENLNLALETFYTDVTPDIIMTGFDEAVYTVQEVLEEAGIVPGSEAWPYLTGFGGEAEAIRDVAEGRIRFTVFMDRRELTQKCVDLVDTCVKGETPEVDNFEQYDNGIRIIGTNICMGEVIDEENYETLVEKGYYQAREVEALDPVLPVEESTTEMTTEIVVETTTEMTTEAQEEVMIEETSETTTKAEPTVTPTPAAEKSDQNSTENSGTAGSSEFKDEKPTVIRTS